MLYKYTVSKENRTISFKFKFTYMHLTTMFSIISRHYSTILSLLSASAFICSNFNLQSSIKSRYNDQIMYFTDLQSSICKCTSCGCQHLAVGPRFPLNIISFDPFPNKPWFICVCITSLLKTVGKGEIACNEQFLLFSVFSIHLENFGIFIKFKILVWKLFQFGRV